MWLQQQIQANNDLEANVVTLPFIISFTLLTNFNLYLFPWLDGNNELFPDYIPVLESSKKLPRSDKSKLLYYVNRLTNVQDLCILSFVTLNILAIVYGEGHLRFFHCYKIIVHFWFIRDLTKLFCFFICHCLQYLTLQTRQHPLYRSL